MSGLSCEELREVAGELASGVLSGSERADALAHLGHCAGCQDSVGGLSEAADWLLLAAPEADPPTGFESRVLSPLTETAPAGLSSPWAASPRSVSSFRTIRWRRAVIGIAAAAAAVVGGTAVVTTTLETGKQGTSHQQLADSTSLRSGSFLGVDGRPVGQIQAYNGKPAWVFMSVDSSGLGGTVLSEVQLANGTTVPIGTFEVHDGVGEWAHTVAMDVGQLHGAKLVTAAGSTLAVATLS